MPGCSNCDSVTGCSQREHRKETLCAEWISKLYPTGTWEQLDDSARHGLERSDALALGRVLSRELRAPVYAAHGRESDLSEALYVLCVGRHPGIIAQPHLSVVSGSVPLREAYLRVLVSSLVRAACVQEVRVRLDPNANTANANTAVVEERARDGVYDPVLLRRFRKITSLLEAHDIEHLDMGVLEAVPKKTEVASYEARFGTPPTYFNWLFLAEPVETVRTSLVATAT